MSGWVKVAVDEWLNVARVEEGLIFRCVTHSGTVWGSGISEKVVWWLVRQSAKKAAIDEVAPHDLRRTCARLCHSGGGELEQIQFLLGHRSVETTERYLGSRQRIAHAVNDKLVSSRMPGQAEQFTETRLCWHFVEITFVLPAILQEMLWSAVRR